MLWKCKNNEHLAWKATFGSIKDCNSWCPKCAGKSKHTLSDCMKWAQNKNGKCLSKEYNNCMTKMLWKCDNSEHSAWSATFNDILSGKWCIHCAGKVKHSIKKCQDFAKNKGGKCLSTKYKNCDTKMLWHCGNTKHPIWKSTFHNIKNRNSWCPYCANVAKMSLKDCQDFAKKKGGMCLSKKYTNNGNEMLWKCHNHKHLSWKRPLNALKIKIHGAQNVMSLKHKKC